MKITGEINQPTNNLDGSRVDYSKPGQTGGALKSGIGGASDLAPGDRFKAGVINATPGSMTLRLENGAVIQAKTVNSPDVHIGDTAIFQVTESFKGKILLEMLKPGGSMPGDINKTAISNGVIRQALMSADMPITEQNIQLTLSLARSGMPIDPATLQSAAFFMYSSPKLSMEQVKFLVNEGFPTNSETIKTLEGMLDKTISLGKNILELLDAIQNLPDETQRNEYLNILSVSGLSETLKLIGEDGLNQDDFIQTLTPADIIQETETALIDQDETSIQVNLDSEETIADDIKDEETAGAVIVDEPAVKTPSRDEGVINKLFAALKEKGLADLPETYKELEKATSVLSELIKERGGDRTLEKPIQDIRSGLEFMNHIQNGKEYVQIPFQNYDTENQAELHVFHNKKRKDAKGGQSALVALDYAELGHVEVLINRNEKAVTLQFKAETQKILNTLGGDIYKLNDALEAKGYKIKGLSFRKLKEQTDITFMPEEIGDITKYSVDVRC